MKCHENKFWKLYPLWCNGYHYCTTSFNQAWTQVLRRFKPCSRRVGDSRWWGSLTMVWQFILWCHGVVVITTAQLHSSKPVHRFCAGSAEIRDAEDLWQWSRLEIRLRLSSVNHTTKTIHHHQLNAVSASGR